MTIEITGIKDSINPQGIRLTSYQLRYPRFIHAEFMTHRMFSRNASSSRAIPVKKQIEAILKDPAIPMHWGKNQKGMQADEECNELLRFNSKPGNIPIEIEMTNKDAWLMSMERAVEIAQAYDKAGYHKQIVNRILEPYAHITVLCTATQYSNFFALRIHKDAMPEIQFLAAGMKAFQDNHEPVQLENGQWHLPYVDSTDPKFIKQSVARSARLSYMTFDMKVSTLEEDEALYEKLVGNHPLHASPAEHQATPDIWGERDWEQPEHHGNLEGYIQYRKLLPGECQ